MSHQPTVSVILVSHNTQDLTLQCIKRVIASRGFAPGEIEIIVVDNNSVDKTITAINREFKSVKVINNQHNDGFGAGNNRGVKLAKGEYLLLLNTDAFLAPDSLTRLHQELVHDHSLLAVSPVLTYPNGQLQQSCGYFPTLYRLSGWLLGLDKIPFLKSLFPRPYHYYNLRAYNHVFYPDWLMGACVLMRRANFDAVGGFDPDIFMYAEEIELFLRLHRAFPGQRSKLTPSTQVIHLGSATSQKHNISRLLLEFEGIIKLYRKHYPSLLPLVNFLIYLGVILRIIIYSLVPSKHHLVPEYLNYFAHRPK